MTGFRLDAGRSRQRGIETEQLLPIHIRARSLLGLGQEELAERSGLGVATVKRLEAAGTEIRGSAQTMARLQRALEAAGIIFIDQVGSNGPGVRLKKPLQ